MFLLNCPFCGEREEREFKCGGQAYLSRPENPSALTDQEWAEYLYYRDDPKGIYFERWYHAYGCRSWFVVRRSTITHEILNVFRMSKTVPEISE
jgi:heterotetrameric sarcosine oxidase delta subunit